MVWYGFAPMDLRHQHRPVADDSHTVLFPPVFLGLPLYVVKLLKFICRTIEDERPRNLRRSFHFQLPIPVLRDRHYKEKNHIILKGCALPSYDI
jgi:hypothetical protein